MLGAGRHVHLLIIDAHDHSGHWKAKQELSGFLN